MTVGAAMARHTAPLGQGKGKVRRIKTIHNAANGQSSTADDDLQVERARLARAAIEARLALEEAVEAAALAAQRARSVSAALEEALALFRQVEAEPVANPAPAADRRDRGDLSPREREVLALVAAGRSNRAIAEELFVSPNTIKTHVASLLNKLHAETRVQLAVIASRQAAI